MSEKVLVAKALNEEAKKIGKFDNWIELKVRFEYEGLENKAIYSIKDLEQFAKSCLRLSQAEKFELAEYYHKQALEYKNLYKVQWEKSGNYVKEIQALELKIKKSQAEVLKEITSVRMLDLVKWEGGSIKDYNAGKDFATSELRKRLLAKAEAVKK